MFNDAGQARCCRNLDDDISVDTENRQAERAAAAVRVFRRLHKALTADGHQVSIGPSGRPTLLPAALRLKAQAKLHQCELCGAAPSSYSWMVKGGWLRKARNRVKSSGAELQLTNSLQLAASWRQGTSHQLCSGCKLWAFEISSAGEKNTQSSETTNGPWAQLVDILKLEPTQAMLLQGHAPTREKRA